MLLETEAGSNSIRTPELRPKDLRQFVMNGMPVIRDADETTIRTEGTLQLLVRLGVLVVLVEFIVCEGLPCPFVLGCDCCARFIAAVRPRAR